MVLHQLLSRLVQVAGAAVITQPFPQAQNFFQLGGCQAQKIGETLQKTIVIGQNAFDPRLLEHDL